MHPSSLALPPPHTFLSKAALPKRPSCCSRKSALHMKEHLTCTTAPVSALLQSQTALVLASTAPIFPSQSSHTPSGLTPRINGLADAGERLTLEEDGSAFLLHLAGGWPPT